MYKLRNYQEILSLGLVIIAVYFIRYIVWMGMWKVFEWYYRAGFLFFSSVLWILQI